MLDDSDVAFDCEANYELCCCSQPLCPFAVMGVLDLGVLQASLKRNAQLFGGFHASRTGGNFRRSDHQPLTLLALENHPRRRINHPPKTGTSLHLHVIDSSAHSIISPRASQTISTSQPKRGPFITAMHAVLNTDFHTVMNDIFLAG